MGPIFTGGSSLMLMYENVGGFCSLSALFGNTMAPVPALFVLEVYNIDFFLPCCYDLLYVAL